MAAFWKLVISLWFMVIGLFVTVGIVFAQSPLPTTSYQLPTTVSPTSPIYTDLLVSNLFHTFSCLAVGQSIIGQPCLTYKLTKNAQGAILGVPYLSSANLSGGLLGTATGLIAGLYANPPVRTSDYLASIGQDLGIVKEVHAQVIGSGAGVLNPIVKLWTVSRNISYIFMIIIFLIIGLMVMFRQRINPQTVITAQAALPGLVIGLILITFSYFLAGLVSDVAFVGTNVVGAYFSAVRDPSKSPQNLVDNISNKNILSIFTPFTKIVSSSAVASAVNSFWNDLHDPNTGASPFDLDPQKVLTELSMFMMTQLVLPFGGLVPGVGQALIGGVALTLTGKYPVEVASLALSFIAIVILIYAMFRLLLRLVNTYLTIIFLTFTAPFQFLFASLPGRQEIATGWILNMLANVLAFPAVLAVLYFVAFILGADNPINKNCTTPCTFIVSDASQIRNNNFNPVYAQGTATEKINVVDKQGFPLFGGLDLDFIRLLLAFGALIALPAIPDLIARSIGRLSQAGQLIGQEISSSVGAGRGYAGQFQQGTSGFVGQVGSLRDQPGYVLDETGWRRVTSADDPYKIAASGARPGLATRIRATFGTLRRGVERD